MYNIAIFYFNTTLAVILIWASTIRNRFGFILMSEINNQLAYAKQFK